jgi:hypothetical protein
MVRGLRSNVSGAREAFDASAPAHALPLARPLEDEDTARSAASQASGRVLDRDPTQSSSSAISPTSAPARGMKDGMIDF